jgi:hypothetical protein
MSDNTQPQTKVTTFNSKKSLARIKPDYWGNNPLEVADKWAKILFTFEGAPQTRREILARQLILDEIKRLNDLAGVK